MLSYTKSRITGKKLVLGFVFFLSVSYQINAQWEWVHPKPTSNSLYSVVSIENVAFTVGNNGTILKSTDTGLNWVVLNSGTVKYLISIFFTNIQQGFAVGQDGTILKTIDSGTNWGDLSSGTENALNSVFFIDQQNGFCCGNNGTFLRTSDAGNSWENIGFINTYDNLEDLYFIDANTGFVVLGHSDNYYYHSYIFKTTDRGTTWTNVYDAYHNRFTSVLFTDVNTGYVTTSSTILKTTDSGISWNILSTISSNYNAISFPTGNLGVAAGWTDNVIQTTDAGNSWTSINLNLSTETIYSIFFLDQNVGIAVGDDGLILRTSDSGNSWEKINKGSDYFFNSVRCKDLNTCYAVGDNWVFTPSPEVGGIVIKTTNGGNDWTIVKSRDGDDWQSIFITENGNVFIASNYGEIIKTTDGGLSWDWLNTGTSEFLTSLYFPNDNVGYAAGLNGIVIKTTDSGNTWNPANIGMNRNLQDVFFTDENTGYVVSGWPGTTGVAGIIYKTTDAGISWNQINNDTSKSLLTIHFPSQNVGYAAGQDCIIYKTTDAGLTWNNMTSLISSNKYITSLFFLNNDVGFATTLSFGNIYKTTDGGNSWSLFSININTNLESVHFADINNGFVAGSGGIILKTTNGGVTFIEDKNNFTQPEEYLLQQNYPNPFNPSTKISWQSPVSSWQTLKVYDVLGNEVATLVNEYRSAGNYEVDFKSTVGNRTLANGVYFYRLQAGNYVETKKMMLLK